MFWPKSTFSSNTSSCTFANMVNKNDGENRCAHTAGHLPKILPRIGFSSQLKSNYSCSPISVRNLVTWHENVVHAVQSRHRAVLHALKSWYIGFDQLHPLCSYWFMSLLWSLQWNKAFAMVCSNFISTLTCFWSSRIFSGSCERNDRRSCSNQRWRRSASAIGKAGRCIRPHSRSSSGILSHSRPISLLTG
jgi:hypothetical protein